MIRLTRNELLRLREWIYERADADMKTLEDLLELLDVEINDA